MLEFYNPQLNKKLQTGFTLIEITVSIFIFTILMLGIVALFSSIFSSSSKQSRLLADEDQSRKVAFGIVKELRNIETAKTGAYGLELANDQEIIFYSNVIGDANPEKIRYYVSGEKLYREVTPYVGTVYPSSAKQTSVAQDDLANETTPLFYYFDNSYNGSGGSLSQPVSPLAVSYIQVNLIVINKAGTGISNYNIKAGAALRKFKTNLGG